MKMYNDCLKDIERAISLSYPENLQHKLYLRKAKCLKFLGLDFEASLMKVKEVFQIYVWKAFLCNNFLHSS